MKNILFIVLCVLILSSCGEIGEEAEKLSVKEVISRVYDAGEVGQQVQDPSSTDSADKVTLNNGYFEFWLTFTNENEKSIVITDFEVELIRDNITEIVKPFSPPGYVPVLPIRDTGDIDGDLDTNEVIDGGVGDVNQRFFAHLDNNSNYTKTIGGTSPGRFYIDGLTRNDNGDFLYTMRVTFRGFVTSITLDSAKDPFTSDEGVFERIAVFTVK